MHYLQEGMGYLKPDFPKRAKIERETPKWSEQVMKFTPGQFGPQPVALKSTSEQLQCRHITQMASFIRLTESKLTQHLPL